MQVLEKFVSLSKSFRKKYILCLRKVLLGLGDKSSRISRDIRDRFVSTRFQRRVQDHDSVTSLALKAARARAKDAYLRVGDSAPDHRKHGIGESQRHEQEASLNHGVLQLWWYKGEERRSQ